MTKLWLKALPEITAETYEDVPLLDAVPAKVHNPRSDPVDYYAAILLPEWSTEEIVPAPESVPAEGYLVLYGDDPARVQYAFHAREIDAAVDASKRSNGFGYVPVALNRNAMIPV